MIEGYVLLIFYKVKPGNLCKRCFRQKERRENILFQVERKEETAYRADRAERVERAKQRRTAQVVEEEEDEDEEESEWEDLLNPSEIKETRVGATYQAEIPSFSVARPSKTCLIVVSHGAILF